ncbi:MAG TPA: DUF1810 domain-containing protein [Solirubrobacteraceae bacterium]|nr:DUF1810 domain-containing protein [Solirubrobacteraceae bacterium]
MHDASSTDSDPLARFVAAQDRDGTYETALNELRHSRKRSHWMWFVFPQLAGLGRSPTARRYAITGLDEARAYLAHPVLGARLRECTEALLGLGDQPAERVLGPIDALKLRSSMTLFARAAPDEPSFPKVLEQWFGREPDPLTEQLLG